MGKAARRAHGALMTYAMAALLALSACGGADTESAADAERREQASGVRGGMDAGGGGGESYGGETIYSEAGKLIRGDESLVALGNEMFGDRVGLYGGSLEFVQTDVSIPGNSGLPVAVGRRHTAPVSVGQAPRQLLNGIFGDWDLEIPHLHGVFGNAGWTVDWPSTQAQERCTRYGAPPPVTAQQGFIGTFNPNEYWQGNSIYVPGSGSQEILKRYAGQAPTDGQTYGLTTKDRWMIRCLPTMTRGAGQGFLAVSPDGTQYKFDWMVDRSYGTLVKGSPAPASRKAADTTGSTGRSVTPTPNLLGGFQMQRKEVWILPTEVIDRHGNKVKYDYDPAAPWRLRSIESEDIGGAEVRKLRLTYDANGLVSTVSIEVNNAPIRTWTYAYRASTAGVGYVLASLTLPSGGGAWVFNLDALTYGGQLMTSGGGCGAENNLDGTPRTGTMTHPSGASASFTLVATQHGRSQVDYYCANMSDGDPNTGNDMYPRFIDRFSITSKTISGPGMTPKTWSYAYGPHNASFAPCSGCAETKTVTVTDPENSQTRYTFGTRFRVTEGQLQKTEEGWNGSTALKTTTRQYAAPAGGPWPDPVGESIQVRGNGELSARHTPESVKVVAQQGATFTWQANGFDQFAKPVDVSRFSSLGYTRRDITAYNNNFTKWVLSQPQTVTDFGTGIVAEQNTYDPNTANRTAKYAFGRLLETTAYHADGTVYTRTDPLNHTTVLTNYKRGLARNASYADGSAESAVVNDDGTVASVTNPAGTTTGYGYDGMGRLNWITYPGGDAATYHATGLYYAQVGSAEYGIAAGHWRLTKQTGNAFTVTYFDAQWRPVMTRTWDAANEAGTRRVKITRYDSAGRKTFESYPQRDIGSVNDAVAGIGTTYDALGRPTQQVATSELGNLTTTTDYLSGFQRRVTNPRGYQTTHAFQTFDEPNEEGITNISAPEGVSVVINRDAFGKPTAITRGGAWGGSGPASVTRSYVYDGYQRLCKTIELESGATVLNYHGNSELVHWRASGQSLPSTTTCDNGSNVPENQRINHSYDARNRLTSVVYGDGSQNFSRSYTPDGLLQQINTSGAGVNPIGWAYSYNNRRLLIGERYTWGDVNNWWDFNWAVDSYGHASTLTDPWGAINYAPNALGEQTQVSGYASGVTYHPNGAVAGYTLANGVTFGMSQYVRGLPAWWTYSGVSNDLYQYDADGNVTAIWDYQEGGSNNRSMGYDGLDRLTQANGPWGVGNFAYDALDNLRRSTVGGRDLWHNYDAANRLASVTGTQTIGFSYNANGNITQRDTQSFVFDIGNRMTSAPGKASYVYDGHGRRNLVWFATGDYMHQAYTKDGKLRFAARAWQGTTRHVYLGDKLIAETVDGGVTTFAHTDALGSPIAKTNSSGGLVSRTRYEPYGATVAGSTNPTKIGFTGHVNDADTGLVYMQQRYYDPIAGRFLSVDPVTTDAKTGGFFNRYVYGNNNPYKFKDPDGKAPGSFDCDCSGGTTNAGLPTSPIVTLQIMALQNGASPAAVQAVTAMAGAIVTRGAGGSKPSANAVAAGSKPLLGQNPKDGGSRTNTDLKGDTATAKSIFRNQTKGQEVTQSSTSDGGVRRQSEDGTQIRMNPDGTSRLDLPGRGPAPNGETVHIPPRETK